MTEFEQGRADARRELAEDQWTREQATQWLALASAPRDEYASGFDEVVRNYANGGEL